MDIEQRLEVLRKLDTKSLIVKLIECEDELLRALIEQANFISQNYDYVASRGSDCSRVKEIVAELSFQAPEVNEAGKKTTVAEREAWLISQRTESKELADAISRQR